MRSGALEGRPGPSPWARTWIRPATWAGAALVTTSPSINPDFPTTEPRLRAALRALVDARAAGDPPAPALVSEAGPVPAAVPGTDDRRDRHEGQDDDGVADRRAPGRRPVASRSILGGNIGIPLVERLPELTPDAPGRLRAVRAATADAVARHDGGGLHERHVRPPRSARLAGGATGAVKRRLAELVDPDRRAHPERRGSRSSPGTPTPAPRRRCVLRMAARPAAAPGGLGVVDGWIVAAGRRRACRSPVAASRRPGRAGGSCRWPNWPSPAPTTSRNALAAIGGRRSCSAWRRTRSGPRRPRSRGVEHRLESVALIDGVRFVNDSQGTQPDAVIAALRAFEAPIVLIAGGRDKGVDLDGAGAGRRRASRSPPCSSARAGRICRGLFRAAGLARTERADRPRRRRSAEPTRSPARPCAGDAARSARSRPRRCC